MMPHSLTAFAAAAVLLTMTGCATTNPHANRGATHFVQAQPTPEQPAPEIVRVPKVVPTPQLRPMPASSDHACNQNGTAGYDVVLNLGSEAAVNKALSALKSHGFTDYFEAHASHAIYLGRYYKHGPAKKRVSILHNRLGFNPHIVPVTGNDANCDLSGPRAINVANGEARQQSTSDNFIGANQKFAYMPGVLYQVWTKPFRITTIALQPGEQLISKAAGDTSRWVIGQTTSGAGAEQRTLVLLKPVRGDLRTNMVLTTNRRVYTLELSSTDGPYNAIVSWRYPKDSFKQMIATTRQSAAAADRTIAANIDPTQLDFNYNIEVVSDTGTPAWTPTAVFTDGHKTYIKFPADLGTHRAPPLFVIQRNGNSSLVNYRIQNNYYVVDQVFTVAELRIGADPQIVVRITHDGGY